MDNRCVWLMQILARPLTLLFGAPVTVMEYPILVKLLQGEQHWEFEVLAEGTPELNVVYRLT